MLTPMITLCRGRDTVALKPALWKTLQDLAMQEGWRPIGVVDENSACKRSIYRPGRAVMARDARALAKALKKLVNSTRFDELEIDLAPLVQLVNFLHGGAFEIR
jgi:hypothetical protein